MMLVHLVTWMSQTTRTIMFHIILSLICFKFKQNFNLVVSHHKHRKSRPKAISRSKSVFSLTLHRLCTQSPSLPRIPPRAFRLWTLWYGPESSAWNPYPSPLSVLPRPYIPWISPHGMLQANHLPASVPSTFLQAAAYSPEWHYSIPDFEIVTF